jgi:hypothetical protein
MASFKNRSISLTAKSGRRVARFGVRSPLLQSRQTVTSSMPREAAVSLVVSARRVMLWPVAGDGANGFTPWLMFFTAFSFMPFFSGNKTAQLKKSCTI